MLVLCTPWPDYLQVPVEDLLGALALAQVVDPAGALRTVLRDHPEVCHISVGTPSRTRPRRASIPAGEVRS